jgi:hypothetical protein
MFKNLFGRGKGSLSERCTKYLEAGPPSHMTDYVPESLTEIVIAHGAKGEALDPELTEVASIILIESDVSSIPDAEIRDYMLNGANLVKEVLESQ